jgi:adenosylcobyric acid synthase
MRLACHARAPVLLVGDIDRGGVFAALLGHIELFRPDERALVAGFVINKFRGDPAQLTAGLELLERRTGVPTLGVVPYLEGWRGDEEDSLALDAPSPRRVRGALEIAVVRLPYLSNTTDFDALAAEPDVTVRYARTPDALRGARLIVVPGTKSTVADLGWLREQGMDTAIIAAAAAGVPVVGICGGYQMLGRRLRDPEGVESPVADSAGLGLLDVTTTFSGHKRTVRATGRTCAGALAGPGLELRGYEIHMGVTRRGRGVRPFASLQPPCGRAREDGAVAAGGLVWGTYLHGLFDSPGFRSAVLDRLRRTAGLPERPPVAAESDIDGLARHVEDHLDVERLDAILGLSQTEGPSGR